MDTEGVKDISPGRGPWAANTEVEHHLGDAPVVRYDSDCESLHAMRGVDGIMPRRQNCGSVDVGGASELCNSTTIVEDNQVCAPLDANYATGSTSRSQPVSSGRWQRR